MQTEVEIERRMSREFVLFYMPVVFLWGVAAAFFIDGFWWRCVVVALVANALCAVYVIRRSLLMRELRLARLGLSD